MATNVAARTERQAMRRPERSMVDRGRHYSGTRAACHPTKVGCRAGESRWRCYAPKARTKRSWPGVLETGSVSGRRARLGRVDDTEQLVGRLGLGDDRRGGDMVVVDQWRVRSRP